MGNTDKTNKSIRAPISKRVLLVLISLCLLAAAVLLWFYNRPPADPPTTKIQPPPDPRLTFNTKFQNVRPHVRYVGDTECMRCHKQISKRYRDHPMGKSLGPFTSVAMIEDYTKAHFTADGFVYEVEKRDDKIIHIEKKLGKDGKELFRREAEISYVVGSGNSGRSYLINLDGFVVQSPISWFAKDNVWKLSPGYENFNHHFERRIKPGCLFCHSNGVKPAGDADNRYLGNIFTGHTIGCERCHGPGELHVRAREENKLIVEPDYTIVNPSHLSPVLRDAVCEQCHLQGLERVRRPGRDWFDYRPGMPIHEFWSVYTQAKSLDPSKRFVSHAEQMAASPCYQKSGGKFSCITCHDPHSVPAENEKVEFYRRACLVCHGQEQTPCNEAIDVRAKLNDDCTACHMPRSDSVDVTHTTTTDHRILRYPKKASKATEKLAKGEMPIVHFHQEQLNPKENRDRDLGIALIRIGGDNADWVRMAKTLVTPALMRWPGDIEARFVFARGLYAEGRGDKAIRQMAKALAEHPKHETTLLRAALLADMLPHESQRAGRLWEKLVQINPYAAEHHFRLANSLASRREWSAAVTSSHKSISLNPASHHARRLLIHALLRNGDKAEAEKNFRIYEQLDVSDVESIRRFFNE